MKIFITGGNGFIGSHVVRLLIEQGHDVRCLVRSTSDTSRLTGLDWEPFIGDVRDRESLVAGAQGCEAIIHLASPSAWNDIQSPHMVDIVLGGTENVLEAARAHGNIRVVFCSSTVTIAGTEEPVICAAERKFEQDGPDFVYAICKLAAENLCLNAVENDKADVVIVNPAEVYGPNDTSMITAGNIKDFIESPVVLVCKGGTSVVHVEDVAFGIMRALLAGKTGSRYPLAGQHISIRELAEMSLRCVDKQSPIIEVPRGLLRIVGKVAAALKIPLPLNPMVIPYATLFWYVDASVSVEELGFGFRDAEATIQPTVEWLVENNLAHP